MSAGSGRTSTTFTGTRLRSGSGSVEIGSRGTSQPLGTVRRSRNRSSSRAEFGHHFIEAIVPAGQRCTNLEAQRDVVVLRRDGVFHVRGGGRGRDKKQG